MNFFDFLDHSQTRLLTVSVSMTAPDAPFNGVFIQARNSQNMPVGTFETAENLKIIDCLDGTQVAKIQQWSN